MTDPERKCMAVLYRQSLRNQSLKGIRVAEELNISRAFVSRVLGTLKTKGILLSTEPLLFSEEGFKKAKTEYARTKMISDFLVKRLNATDQIAWTDALNVTCALSERNLRAIDYHIRKQEIEGGN